MTIAAGLTGTHGKSIVRDGLVLYIDAALTASYPGSGTTWYDISGSGYNGTMSNVTFGNNNYGVMKFVGTGSSVSFTNPNLSTSSCTIMGAARYTGSTRGRLITSSGNNWLLGHWSSGTVGYYAEGWITSSTAAQNDTNWRIYAATEDYAGDSRTFYVNNSSFVGPSNAGSAGPNGFRLGASPYNEYTDGEIGFVLAYNRVLTTNEMSQNFNAFRQRYGL